MLSEVVTTLENDAALDDVERDGVVLCRLELVLVTTIDVVLNCAEELGLGLDEASVELLCTCVTVKTDEVLKTMLVVEIRRVELDGTTATLLLCVVTTGALLEVPEFVAMLLNV